MVDPGSAPWGNETTVGVCLVTVRDKWLYASANVDCSNESGRESTTTSEARKATRATMLATVVFLVVVGITEQNEGNVVGGGKPKTEE